MRLPRVPALLMVTFSPPVAAMTEALSAFRDVPGPVAVMFVSPVDVIEELPRILTPVLAADVVLPIRFTVSAVMEAAPASPTATVAPCSVTAVDLASLALPMDAPSYKTTALPLKKTWLLVCSERRPRKKV